MVGGDGNPFRAFGAALQFLTRLPVPRFMAPVSHEAADFRRSAPYYPAAGLAIGLLLAAAAWLLAWALPPWPAAVLLTAAWVALSGGLHLDGLMDTADGLLSHRSRERMLEIMKDSRVGAMGVAAGALALLLRAALLASLLEMAPGALIALGLIAIPIWSRAFLVTAIAGWPYARAEGAGLGGLFRAVKAKQAWAAALLSAVLTSAALAAVRAWSPAGSALALLLAAAVAYGLGALLASSAARKLGGLTGDVYGALNESIELALLLALVVCVNHAGP
ncbi:adenosylcobinamide-GDP ribazoletransferase [Cohnella fermenti]|uniref:Adenosylcobinamide-GDP ribazoletransferase n=1 Tax=Cohnella fermenti TaxID=2565925 RepID=A0A4S4BJU7_9BACL|nr:adenosylcobinamide-GDP ribazoletransferase [Cohnella fermenti]THF74943.1 adenosylcobinamide-GDP ribazoletransferase [Cohnella fermenti]